MAAAGHAADERTDESRDTTPDAQARQVDALQAQPSDHDLIARRAYERFQMRGGEHGYDQDDWLEAEREVEQTARARS